MCNGWMGGNPILMDCTFSENSAGAGGGMTVWGSPVLIRCTFNANSADGGGALNTRYGNPTIINCVFTSNRANRGGALHIYENSPTVTNCVFVGNSATGNGGAVNNEAWQTTSALATFVNCTFVDNESDSQFGGVGNLGYCHSILSNCILWHNRDTDGFGPSSQIPGDGGSVKLTLTHCCIQGWTVGGRGRDPNGNINANPLFAHEPDDGGDGWGDNTATPDVNEAANDDFGDLRLQPGSLCIDAGNNSAVPPDSADLDSDGDTNEPIPWDLSGKPRFIDDPATFDGGSGRPPIVDMGAYEFVPPPLLAMRLVARPQPTDCTATTVPEHWPTYHERETFYLELWAQVSHPPAGSSGLSCVFADVAFDSDIVSAKSVESCGSFATFSSGTIKDDLIDELGGCTLTAGLAIAPQGALIARVRMIAYAQGQTDISLSGADTACSVIGYGRILSEQIALESCQVTVGSIPETCIYDLDGDGFLGPGDLSLFVCCWLRAATDSGCDGKIPCVDSDFDWDGTIGPGDLAWFATGWLNQCGDPAIKLPLCRRGSTAGGIPSVWSSRDRR